jgi:hypothetical protein
MIYFPFIEKSQIILSRFSRLQISKKIHHLFRKEISDLKIQSFSKLIKEKVFNLLEFLPILPEEDYKKKTKKYIDFLSLINVNQVLLFGLMIQTKEIQIIDEIWKMKFSCF